MQTMLKRLTVLCSGAMLLACTGAGAPLQVAARRTADAEQAYLIGRSHHMALRPQQALAYYRSALREAPTHVNARNGLAVLYAEQGQLDLAIGLWQEMTATASGREQAFLFSNLGYAHLIHGEPARALAVLEQACLLDPLSERAWQHLGDALEQTGQRERAAAMHRQAASLRGHDLRADLAVAASASADANGSAAAPAGPWARTEVSMDSGGMFVLRRVAQQQQLAGAKPASAPAAMRAQLEISNGNGVTGMARSLASTLGEHDPRVVRLSNQKGFAVTLTRIEYQPAFRDAAEQLAGRVGAVQVIPADQRGRADLRLVLGRDLARLPHPAAKTS
ncbi:MAG: tetratricopeptide repeat protein [Pseudomonadota bacterium]